MSNEAPSSISDTSMSEPNSPPPVPPHSTAEPGSLAAAKAAIETQLPRTSTLSILCLASAVAGWSLLPILGAVLALVFGKMAKDELRQANGRLDGAQLVTIGTIIAIVELSLIALSLVVLVLALLVPMLIALLSHR